MTSHNRERAARTPTARSLPGSPPRPGRLGLIAVLLTGIASTSVGGLWLTSGATAPAAATSVGSVPPASAEVAAPHAHTVTPSPTPPTAIHIPALGVHAAVVPVLAPGSALDVPADPQIIGWWSAGPKPGSPAGTVVLAGHIDTAERGLGAFAALARAEPGTRAEVITPTAVVPYRIVARTRYPKTTLPTELFAPYGSPRLALITCGGTFNERTRHYTDNLVVLATPEA